MIHIININNEDKSKEKNFYYCGRPSILGNPYTHLDKEQTLAVFQCQDRDESIDKYSDYYDIMYGHNIEFTTIIDEIYEKYKNGEEIYLGCFCKPKRCHCDVIKQKFEERLIREKLKQLKRNI